MSQRSINVHERAYREMISNLYDFFYSAAASKRDIRASLVSDRNVVVTQEGTDLDGNEVCERTYMVPLASVQVDMQSDKLYKHVSERLRMLRETMESQGGHMHCSPLVLGGVNELQMVMDKLMKS